MPGAVTEPSSIFEATSLLREYSYLLPCIDFARRMNESVAESRMFFVLVDTLTCTLTIFVAGGVLPAPRGEFGKIVPARHGRVLPEREAGGNSELRGRRVFASPPQGDKGCSYRSMTTFFARVLNPSPFGWTTVTVTYPVLLVLMSLTVPALPS